MKVKVTQLIPGCILQEAVIGKTGKAIIPEQTIITDEHINILQKFLITDVHIFHEMEDGSRFTAKQMEKAENSSSYNSKSFTKLYNDFVYSYKHQFNIWKVEQKVDIATLRQTINPLFKRIERYEIIDLIKQIDSLTISTFYAQQTFSSLFAFLLAKHMKYNKGELYQIGLATLLKDSGFIKYSTHYYEQATKLFLDDYSEIKQHPVYSYRLVEHSPLLNQAAKLSILQHEEQIDGKGYPLKLKAADIHRYAKIIAISAEFTRAFQYFMTKSKSPLIEAVKHIKAEQSKKLDSKFVHIFINQLTKNN